LLVSRLACGQGRAVLRTSVDLKKRCQNAILKAEIIDLKQGLEAVEDIARSELGLIKKGETFFLLVED
jgi:cell division protein FtsB